MQLEIWEVWHVCSINIAREKNKSYLEQYESKFLKFLLLLKLLEKFRDLGTQSVFLAFNSHGDPVMGARYCLVLCWIKKEEMRSRRLQIIF
jgi:hypothetical protein